MKIISIINQKGGVAKTTTAANIGAILASQDKKVLFVDLDAQANLTYIVNANPEQVGASELLASTARVEQVIQHAANVDIIAANGLLAAATYIKEPDILAAALKPLRSKYDYIIIDCSPSLNILTINALAASSHVIIPVQADVFSLQAIGDISKTVAAVQEHTNNSITIAGIVVTRFNKRSILAKDLKYLIELKANTLNINMFNTVIRECTALKEAQAMKQAIIQYAPRSNAAADYKALTKEIIKILGV